MARQGRQEAAEPDVLSAPVRAAPPPSYDLFNREIPNLRRGRWTLLHQKAAAAAMGGRMFAAPRRGDGAWAAPCSAPGAHTATAGAAVGAPPVRKHRCCNGTLTFDVSFKRALAGPAAQSSQK